MREEGTWGQAEQPGFSAFFHLQVFKNYEYVGGVLQTEAHWLSVLGCGEGGACVAFVT
jgi:hypothetical protein